MMYSQEVFGEFFIFNTRLTITMIPLCHNQFIIIIIVIGKNTQTQLRRGTCHRLSWLNSIGYLLDTNLRRQRTLLWYHDEQTTATASTPHQQKQHLE